jgi:hypothetical protein
MPVPGRAEEEVSLTCELWDAVGPLLRTECTSSDGKPPLEIGYQPIATGDASPTRYARHFKLACVDREAEIFIYHEVPATDA